MPPLPSTSLTRSVPLSAALADPIAPFLCYSLAVIGSWAWTFSCSSARGGASVTFRPTFGQLVSPVSDHRAPDPRENVKRKNIRPPIVNKMHSAQAIQVLRPIGGLSRTSYSTIDEDTPELANAKACMTNAPLRPLLQLVVCATTRDAFENLRVYYKRSCLTRTYLALHSSCSLLIFYRLPSCTSQASHKDYYSKYA